MVLVLSVEVGFCGQNPFNPLQFDSAGPFINLTNGVTLTNPAVTGAITLNGSTNIDASLSTNIPRLDAPFNAANATSVAAAQLTGANAMPGSVLPLVGTFQTITVTNPATFKNNVTNFGTNFSAGGYASSNTAAAVAIVATGITNNLGVNAKVFLTAVGVTYTNFNNAGTAYLTNKLTGTNVFVDVLQPNGKITTGSGLAGRLVPL